MKNASPGSPDLTVISFKSAFHGRLLGPSLSFSLLNASLTIPDILGSLSLTRSKAIHKLDVPSFDWPSCTFPLLQYPLEDFVTENAECESRAIAEVEETILAWRAKGKPVAALIVEPIQSG